MFRNHVHVCAVSLLYKLVDVSMFPILLTISATIII